MDIELINVCLQYGHKAILQNICMNIADGEFVVIQGKSGVGKSSLLRLLNRLEEPTSGAILLDGQSIRTIEVTKLRRRIGYVQQLPVMIPGSIRENLLLPFRFRVAKMQKTPGDPKLRTLLEQFLLQDIQLSDEASQLSIGQQQRIALLRILLTEPDVLLCDEPTSALDTQSREMVEQSLVNLHQQQQTTIVLVTHGVWETSNSARLFKLTSKAIA